MKHNLLVNGPCCILNTFPQRTIRQNKVLPRLRQLRLQREELWRQVL
jgi:hypothetical protein